MNEAFWGPKFRPAIFAAAAIAVGLLGLVFAI